MRTVELSKAASAQLLRDDRNPGKALANGNVPQIEHCERGLCTHMDRDARIE